MKKVIYTAIFGDYDRLKPISYHTEAWDYICFTDNENLTKKGWTIIPMGNDVYMTDVDPVRKARRIKILFHDYCNDYDISIWHDASTHIGCNLDKFIDQHLLETSDMSLMLHPVRDCLYKEAEVCAIDGKDYWAVIGKQMAKYIQEGYPRHNGLVNSALIIRKNLFPVRELMQIWWKEVENYSRRDQLSFNYALWKCNLPVKINLFDTEVLKNEFLRTLHLK